jgi:hypothetical protein
LDFYQTNALAAVQIVPDEDHWTIDIPDLSKPWSLASEPAWQWLFEPWKYGLSPQAIAVTNLRALRGEPITEAARWETNQWELFAGAGPDVHEEAIRLVPLGMLLGADESLGPVASLAVGSALWRDPGSEWRDWPKNPGAPTEFPDF